jgi:hypothetical protein
MSNLTNLVASSLVTALLFSGIDSSARSRGSSESRRLHLEGERAAGIPSISNSTAPPSTDEGRDPAIQQGAPLRIPLCAGLTIVTAISQQTGDYESIKTILSLTNQEVRLKYSSEHMTSDLLSNEKPKLERTTVVRTIRTEDLANANLYEQQFYEKLPELIAGTTAIGTSAAVLHALKTTGEAEIGIFIAFTGEPSLDRDVHPNVFDNEMVATIHRVEPAPVMLPLIVNNQRVQLPAIHAMGEFSGDKTEFFFLDDPANPIALKWR